MRRLARVLLAALAIALAPAGAAAQANSCVLLENRAVQTQGSEPNVVAYVSGPLFVRCDAGEQLRADSAVLYQGMNEVHLYGRVDYQDPTRSLNSDYATYNSATGRLYATGSVVFTDKNRGSTLRGPELEYFRAGTGRPEAQMIAPQRPHLTLVPKQEAGGQRRDPLEIDADRVTTVGERYMQAEGRVVITGKNLDASSQEAFYDADQDRLELRRDARVRGGEEEKFDLSGALVEADMTDGRMERVLARTEAQLVSEKLRVDGPEIRLFFTNDSLQRLTAGRGQAENDARPIATAKGFLLQGDSLDAVLPGQQLKTVTAIGRARGEAWDTLAPPANPATAPRADSLRGVRGDTAAGAADSLALRALALRDRDLVFGDTLTGFFVQTDTTTVDSLRFTSSDSAQLVVRIESARALGDSAGVRAGTEEMERRRRRRPPTRTELERMLAVGDARSLYRVRDKEEEARGRPPGLNYLIGDTIDIAMADGEVDTARVFGLDRGVYLDPQRPRSDSAARADSVGARTTADGAAPTATNGAPASPSQTPAQPASPAVPTPANPTGAVEGRRTAPGTKPGGRR